MKTITLATLSLIACTACSQNKQPLVEYTKIYGVVPESEMAALAAYAMASTNANIHNTKDRYDLTSLGYTRVDLNGRATNDENNDPAMQFFNVYYAAQKNKFIIAFKGNGSWFEKNLTPLSTQYSWVEKQITQLKTRYPNSNMVVTGSDLGAGLALAASIDQCIPAVLFNPSARVYKSLDFQAQNCNPIPNRIVVVQKQESLRDIEQQASTFKQYVNDKHIYRFNNALTAPITLDAMALELLKNGSVADPELKRLYKEIDYYTPMAQ